MTTVTKRIAAFFLLLTFLTGSASAQNNGTLVGHVVNGVTGLPIAGAAVGYDYMTFHELQFTDSSGYFRLIDLPFMTNAVHATVISGPYGMTTRTITIAVVGDTIRRNFPLYPRSPLVVSLTGDSGPGTLRDAVNTANASPDTDYIMFDIGAGGATIQLSSTAALSQPVFIDGSTQPEAGYIELDGSLSSPGSIGLDIASGGCTIRGLVINRYSTALSVTTGSGTVIEGNRIGTNTAGTLALANNTGIVVLASGNTVGGTTAAKRNIISGNNTGVLIEGPGLGQLANNNRVVGNFVGLDVTGHQAVPNTFRGIFITDGSGNVIGGISPGERNVISGNLSEGVVILDAQSTGNLIIGNSTVQRRMPEGVLSSLTCSR